MRAVHHFIRYFNTATGRQAMLKNDIATTVFERLKRRTPLSAAQPAPAAQMMTANALPAYTTAPKPPAAAPKPSAPAAPRPEPSTAQTPAQIAADGKVTLKIVQTAWRDILIAVKKRNPMAEALLRSGNLVGVQGNQVRMSFPSQLLKERADKVKPKIIEALDSVLGIPVGVDFIVGVKNAPPSAPTPALAKQTNAPGASPEEDGLIKAALEMGGQIKT
jgi:hypothetical protein